MFSKAVNSVFIGTGLESHLRSAAIDKLVIIGLTTDLCVSASSRLASDLGFEVTLISDASTAFERIGYDGNHYSGEQIHRVNLVGLDGEFYRVRSTEEILDSMARSSRPSNDGGATT